MGDVHKALALAQVIDDLVFQNREDPGFQSRLSSEPILSAQGGGQRLLNRILGGRPVAKLQFREAEQVAAQARQKGLIP